MDWQILDSTITSKNNNNKNNDKGISVVEKVLIAERVLRKNTSKIIKIFSITKVKTLSHLQILLTQQLKHISLK